MNEKLNRALRDSGYLDVFEPAAKVRHEQAIRQAVDRAGQLADDVAARVRTPLTLDWSTIDGRAKRTPQAGTLVLLWAHANTAPSTGSCVIQYTLETKTQGATPIATVTIERNQTIGEAVFAQPLPAGAYLNPSVTSAGGASAVSTGIVIKAGV